MAKIEGQVFSLHGGIEHGVVDVPGIITVGDVVAVNVYETPEWLRR